MRRIALQNLSVPVVALLMLAGVDAERRWLHVSADHVDGRHLAVREATGQIADRIGDWIGAPQPLSPQLGPVDVARHYRYVNVATGETANILLLYYRDAREMFDHDPAEIYARAGWTLRRTQPTDWRFGDDVATGMTFHFLRPGDRGAEPQCVTSVLILPDGRFVRDVLGLEATASHYTRRYLGVGQVQIITPDDMTTTRRNAIIRTMLDAFRPVMTAIQSGGVQ